MELKFIWIKKYKNIESTGFTFSNPERQRFHYSDGILELTEDQLSEPGEFFSTNLTSVTAIVGRNGSGKTNISEFIHYHLCNFYEGSIANWGLKPISIIVIGNIISHHKTLQISNASELTEKGFKILEYESTPFDNDLRKATFDDLNLDETAYIYYSNIFDNRATPSQQNLIDISTNYLLLQQSYYHRGYHIHGYSENKPEYWFKERTNAFIETENTRIVEFVLETGYPYPFTEKPTATISLDYSRENNFLEFEKTYPYVPNAVCQELENAELKLLSTAHADLILDGTVPHLQGTLPAASAKMAFLHLYLTNLLKSVVFQVNYTANSEFFTPQDVNNTIFDSNSFPAANNLQTKVSDVKKKLLKVLELATWHDQLLNLYDDKRGPDMLPYERSIGGVRNLFLDIDTNEKFAAFKDLILTTNLVTSWRKFSTLYFGEYLSSGQNSLITFLARMHQAAKDLTRRTKTINHIKLFIDEGDIAMHPEWQREFFQTTLDFLKKEFPTTKIQLLLISHSPFLVSDLPKNNIIFLDRDEKGKCKLSSFDRAQTFGSNIHTLFRDSFFMRNGLMGGFAQNKIKKLIDSLSKNGDIPEQEAEHTIQIVGDELIRERLKDLFKEKYKVKETLSERINRLRDELKDAENDLNSTT